MGFLGYIFGSRRGVDNNISTPTETSRTRKTMNIIAEGSKYQVISVDENNNATCLIVNRNPEYIYAPDAYNCLVSWYKEPSKRNFLDKYSSEPQKFIPVIAQLNMDAFWQDSRYYDVVMQELLEERRVKELVKCGLEECTPPNHPSYNYYGNYIGKVEYMSDETGRIVPKKTFYQAVGNLVNRSSKTKELRVLYQAAKERAENARRRPREYYPEIPKNGYDELAAFKEERR